MSDNSSDLQPKGILRNAQTHDYASSLQSNYDRKLVLENTKKNAELFKQGQTEGDKIRQQIAKKKKLSDDNVQFNKENLAENDKLKASMTFTKIDEPKTPYQGPINEENDYYRLDNEEEIPDFTLGEGEDDNDEDDNGEHAHAGLESLHGSKIIPADEVAKAKREKGEKENSKVLEAEKKEAEEQEEQEENLTPEQLKHKKFEEMRKKHYHNEVVQPLKAQKILDAEEDEDEE